MSQRVLRDRQASQISLSQLSIVKKPKRKNTKSKDGKENPAKRAKKELQFAVEEIKEIVPEALLSPRRTARKVIPVQVASEDITDEIALPFSPRRTARKAQAHSTPPLVQPILDSIDTNAQSLFSPRRTARHTTQPALITVDHPVDVQNMLSPRTRRTAASQQSRVAEKIPAFIPIDTAIVQDSEPIAVHVAAIDTIESIAAPVTTITPIQPPVARIDPLAYPNDPLLVNFPLIAFHKKQLYKLPAMRSPSISSLSLTHFHHLTSRLFTSARTSHHAHTSEHVAVVNAKLASNKKRADEGKAPMARTSQLTSWFNRSRFILTPQILTAKTSIFAQPALDSVHTVVDSQISATQQVVQYENCIEKRKATPYHAQIVEMTTIGAGCGVDSHAHEAFLPHAYSYLNLAIPYTLHNHRQEKEVHGREVYALRDGKLKPFGRFLVSMKDGAIKCEVKHRYAVVGTTSTVLFESASQGMRVQRDRNDMCYVNVEVEEEEDVRKYVFWLFCEKDAEGFVELVTQRL